MSAPPDPLMIARVEMAPGETLIWADRPTSRASRIWPMTLFGVLFFGFALFWTAQAWQAGGAIAVFGIPFLGIGAVLLTAPWRRPKRTRHTVYAISDQRLLVIRGWPTRVVQSFAPQDIGRLEQHERADGSGDLVFREEHMPQVVGGRRRHWRRRWRTRRNRLLRHRRGAQGRGGGTGAAAGRAALLRRMKAVCAPDIMACAAGRTNFACSWPPDLTGRRGRLGSAGLPPWRKW